MATTVDNKAVAVMVHKGHGRGNKNGCRNGDWVMVVAMVAMDLAIAETIKDMVGLATALIPNIGMACPGRSALASWKHATMHAVPRTPT